MKQKSLTGSAMVNVAPCLSHPCDSPGGSNPCNNCAFARTHVAANHATVAIDAATYGCKMGGSILVAGSNVYMKVGTKTFPARQPENSYIVAAQKRLHAYLQ